VVEHLPIKCETLLPRPSFVKRKKEREGGREERRKEKRKEGGREELRKEGREEKEAVSFAFSPRSRLPPGLWMPGLLTAV
jgi:hypothetical protein